MSRKSIGANFFISTVGILLILLSTFTVMAKNVDDVVTLKNGDRMTGEIKGLERGELRIKSDYMAEAVRLDWARVEGLESKSRFMIWLVDGKLFTNFIRLLPAGSSDKGNFVIGSPNDAIKVKADEVLRITPAKAGFWKQLDGSIDLGLGFSSGNNQYHTDLIATTTYRRGDHSYTGSIDSALSGQRKGTSTSRNQFTFDYRKQISPRWYAGGLFDLLTSEQQSLDRRTSVGGIIGASLRQTSQTRFSVFGGVAASRETYSTPTGPLPATNADAIVGFDFTAFRFKTTDIRSRFISYPSLTTPGRIRAQIRSDLHLKIVKDLYWGFHVYENFDSKPPILANKNDLGISSSFGWKF
jgi:hypothetical protein